MTYYVTYRLDTGEILNGGQCVRDDLFKQAGDGIGVVEVLRDPMVRAEVPMQTMNRKGEMETTMVPVFLADIEAPREALHHIIDLTASELQANASGGNRAPIYAAKAAEARSWKKGAKAPILTAEAAARGVPVSELQKQVIAKADAADQAVAEIEAKRIGGKLAVSAAGNVAEMVEASKVDWTTNG